MLSHSHMFKALKAGDIATVEHLISQGANMSDMKWYGGMTPLHVAVKYGHIKLMQLLLFHDKINIHININALNDDDQSFLYLACKLWLKRQKQSLPCEELEMIIVLLFEHYPTRANLVGFDIESFNILFHILKKQSRDECISVDLSNRLIGDTEMKSLAFVLALEHTYFISKLNLARNIFSDEGMLKLGSALKVNKGIQSLDLSSNRIGDTWIFFSGIQCLTVSALYENITLNHLNISDCVLDKADITTLLEFLKISRSHDRLKHIELTVPKTVLASLAEEDKNIILATQRLAKYLNVIKECQEYLLNFRYSGKKEEKELFEGCWRYLENCRKMYAAENDPDGHYIIPCLDGVAAGLIEFANKVSAKDYPDFTLFLKDVLHILELARTSAFNQVEKEKIYGKTPVDVFRTTFENNMNALHSAAMVTKNGYVKNQIKTPVEKYAKVARNIIASLLSGSQVIEVAADVVHIVGEKYISAAAEGLHHLTNHDPLFHYGADYLGDKIIKALYGLTELEKYNNLILCFTNKSSEESKVTAIAHAIMHHYRDSIAQLPVEKAEKLASILARYAFLHIAQLLMSGILLESKQKLTSAVLIEEVIHYLSYISLQENGVRVNIMTHEEKEIAKQFFRQAKVKFDDNIICTVSTYNKNGYFMKQSGDSARLATQTETNLVNDLIKKPILGVSDNEVATTHETIVKHQLFFNKQELIKLKETGQSVETTLSSHQSKRKTLNTHGEILIKLSERVGNLEHDSHQKDEIIQEKNNEIIKLKTKQKEMQIKLNSLENKIETNKTNRTKLRLSL